MNHDTKIISVISGKGGTGKSLFTAVLGNCLSKENCRVLLVDMDIHVRGLTILLSKYMGTSDRRMSVAKYLSQKDEENNFAISLSRKDEDDDFAIFRFQECEFIPSVIDIAEPLSRDRGNGAFGTFFEKLEQYVDGRYDIVLLDCRSGLDDAVVFSASHSDFIISISEDDDVCLQANTNLVNYLRYEKKINNIYTVINKGRRINNKSDIEEKINNIFDFSCIGAIPFDERIMEDYGKDRFWLSVYDTLYFYGIVKFWRKFQEKTQLPFKIDEERYSFKEINIVKMPITSSYTRMMRLYGFVAVLVGVLLPMLASFTDSYLATSFDKIGTLMAIMGLLMIFISSKKFRMFLLGKDDDPVNLKQ